MEDLLQDLYTTLHLRFLNYWSHNKKMTMADLAKQMQINPKTLSKFYYKMFIRPNSLMKIKDFLDKNQVKIENKPINYESIVDKQELVNRVKNYLKKEPVSLKDLSRQIGITFITFDSFMHHPENAHRMTIDKIKNLLDRLDKI